MGIEVVYNGAGHPQAGQIAETINHPDHPSPPLDHGDQRRAMIRARAVELDKKGKYLEASALRASIGE